jgi:hypothetical protein
MKDTTVRRSHRGIRPAIGLGAVGSLLLFGAPGVAADPLIDGPGDGTYLLADSDGQKEVWNIRACGPRCLTINGDNPTGVSGAWIKQSGPDPRYHPGDWYVQDVPGTSICPDGTKVLNRSQSYVFNAVTLTGTIQIYKWDGCASHGGGNALPPKTTFTMSKT